MKEISKAIVAVMKAVKGMEKNAKVGAGNSSYNGTKDQDVKEVFNDALSQNGLCMIPQDIEETTQIDRWDELDSYSNKMKTKQSIFTKVKVKYLLLHTSGESIVVCGYGHGIDTQDKGAGKATTYAMKNALLYTFLTPVGKIDDTETTHSDDIKTPNKVVVKKENVMLTEDQFALAMQGTKKGIIATLSKFNGQNGYGMSAEFLAKLTEQLSVAQS